MAWKLCTATSVLVARRSYLERAGEPQEPDDLARHSCLYYPRGNEHPAWTFERGTHRVTVPITGCFATNNSEASRDAALDHLGIALLPDFSAHAALARGKLVRVAVDRSIRQRDLSGEAVFATCASGGECSGQLSAGKTVPWLRALGRALATGCRRALAENS
ncbi:hypothetical protein METHP14_10311 [Pseudomonas sp. P14-2025]